MIKILVVEDSPVVREFLLHIFGQEPDLKVVGTASDGEAAIEAVQRLRPDVVTMDIEMPKMNGIEATRHIMETVATPVVVVSGSTDPHDVAITFRAMEAGALAVLRRPPGIGHPDHERAVKELLRTVRAMSEVRVVRRWAKPQQKAISASPVPPPPVRVPQQVAVVALGASTGGPPVLQTILSGLPRDFPVPVLIVQHMARGFVQGFIEWLAHFSVLPVRLAAQGEYISAGTIYVAPDGFQMSVRKGGRIALDPCGSGMLHCPSVASLFQSLADSYGGEVVAGLLTGMGSDGAAELKLLRDRGAFTFAQNEASSVVYGMPGAAAKAGAAMLELAPEKIAPLLVNTVRNCIKQ